MIQKEPETCGKCIFFRQDGDEEGTCIVSDNIVDPMQEACNDYK